ncbi:MAG: hypothetical protein ACRYFS_22735 [Janthinobacterium lividum]
MVKALEGLENIFGGLCIAATWLAPFVLAVVLIDKLTKKPQTKKPYKVTRTPLPHFASPAQRGLHAVRRCVGTSLPIAVLCYLFMFFALIFPEWLSSTPVSVHMGLDIWGPFLVSVTTALIVLPLAVRDLIRKQWFGGLAIPLALGLFFVWSLLYSHLISTGHVILEE